METSEFKMKIGDNAPDFRLLGVDSNHYSLNSFQGKSLVVIFTCNHCPYAKAYEKRLIHLAEKFSRSFAFVAINSNDSKGYPDDSFENMKIRSQEQNFPYPYLHDETSETAKSYGALVTPHIFVFDLDRKLVYQGGVDDNWENPDKVLEKYLEDALDNISQRKVIAKPVTPAIGCSIKWN